MVREVGSKLKASGGEEHLLEPWSPVGGSLEPLTYRYDLPREGTRAATIRGGVTR